jgi:hypothetical protein
MTSTTDINDLLHLFLGADEKGGFQPIGCDERFRRAFPDTHGEKMRAIQRYLDAGADYQPDWSKNDLVAESRLFAKMLEASFPELDLISVRALANRFSFDWK